MSNLKEITKLINEYNLHPEDVFTDTSSGLKIIRRRGYKKIQESLKLSIMLQLSHSTVDSAVVLAKGVLKNHDGDCVRQTFGEASPANNTFPYPVSVAQKRAEGRLILEMANLYERGFYTEDEIDEKVKGVKRKKELTLKAQDSIAATLKAIKK